MSYKLSNKKWVICDEHDEGALNVDHYLMRKLMNVIKIVKNNWDCLILIDGKEGSGKSVLGLLIAWILTFGGMKLNNMAENTADAVSKLKNLPDGSLLLIDEGGLSFSSKDAIKTEQKNLIKILEVIRQKRMILIVVAPQIFDLNKYIAVHRSRFLLHVYTGKNLERGRFAYFGEKAKRLLYTIGKKNYNSYSKPRANHIGKFPDFKPPFYKEYLEMKKNSLFSAFGDDEKKVPTEREIRIKICKNIRENFPKIPIRELAVMLCVSDRTVNTYLTS